MDHWALDNAVIQAYRQNCSGMENLFEFAPDEFESNDDTDNLDATACTTRTGTDNGDDGNSEPADLRP